MSLQRHEAPLFPGGAGGALLAPGPGRDVACVVVVGRGLSKGERPPQVFAPSSEMDGGIAPLGKAGACPVRSGEDGHAWRVSSSRVPEHGGQGSLQGRSRHLSFRPPWDATWSLAGAQGLLNLDQGPSFLGVESSVWAQPWKLQRKSRGGCPQSRNIFPRHRCLQRPPPMALGLGLLEHQQ